MGLAPSLVINLPGYPFESFPSVATIDLLRAIPSAAFSAEDNYVVDGATVAGDGGGGLFSWSSASTAADDGVSVIRPSDKSPGQAGRWVQAAGGLSALSGALASPSPGKGAALVNFSPFQMEFTQASDAPVDFDMFEEVDPGRTARHLISPAEIGTHVGELFSGLGVKFRPEGSGANGPQNADVAFSVSAIKPDQTVGEMDVAYLIGQQKGVGSDIAGVLCDISRRGGTGFSAQWEGVTKDVDEGTGVTLAATRTQYGMRDTVTGLSAGYYANAQAGFTKYGLLLSSDPGIFENFISCFFGSTGLPVFNVNRDGEMVIRKGGLLDGVDNSQIASEYYAATGSSGSGGNTLGVYSEFRHYTTPVDWRTAEYRIRLGVDGVSTPASSPWYSLRGRSGDTSSFAIGFGYAASPTVEVRNTGHIRSALLPSLNYADDAAAAAGGVAVGELYHTAGTVKVRIT